jgi:hypothetical protein
MAVEARDFASVRSMDDEGNFDRLLKYRVNVGFVFTQYGSCKSSNLMGKRGGRYGGVIESSAGKGEKKIVGLVIEGFEEVSMKECPLNFEKFANRATHLKLVVPRFTGYKSWL